MLKLSSSKTPSDSANKIKALEDLVIELQTQNHLYEQLLELSTDAAFVKDKAGRFVYANKAATQPYLQKTTEQLINTRVDSLYSQNQIQRFKQSDKRAFDLGYYEALENILMPNETEIIAKVAKKAFRGIDGAPYLACISRDESERERLIKDLHRSNEDLDSFAYVASHDLRAPLNAIQTMINWVIEDCEKILPLDSKENLLLALSRAKRMEQLLKDLLEYSRIGRRKEKPAVFNLRRKIFEWLDLVELPMGFSLLCDDVDVELPELPLNVVMINLISNAVKHHDSSTANIRIRVRSNKRNTVLEVEDDGPGIPDNSKDKVFELFQTLKPRDEIEASGMGLSVVKKIITNYGGSITIKDKVPRGCRFILHWPKTQEQSS